MIRNASRIRCSTRTRVLATSRILLLTMVGMMVVSERGGAADAAQQQEGKGAATPQASAAPLGLQCPLPGAADIAATVDGQRITVGEVDARLGIRLAKIRSEEYELRMRALDELIAERQVDAAARKAGLTSAQLLAREARAADAASEEASARELYRALPQRFTGLSEAAAVTEIRGALAKQRETAARARIVSTMATEVERRLQPFRIAVDTTRAPFLGSATAPIEIVGFSDFQCPFCARSAEVVKQLAEKHAGRVRVVYRHFPLLSIHKEAAKAAEAASCAGDQRKFWEMHDRMFANQQTLQVPALKQMAAQLGLDAARFDACLDGGTYAAEWQRGLTDGTLYGVTGTPTYFVNGRLFTGGATMEQFERIITEELALVETRPRTESTGRTASKAP